MDPIQIPTSKRIFDIMASCVVLLALSPILLILFIFFFVEQLFTPPSRGPLFYKETRISQGRPFPLWKIRTFKISALADARGCGSVMIHTKNLEKARGNMTLVGHILRQIYMDEVPQLFSVLIGDMSFVGPRPTNPENYTKDIEKGFQSKRILRAGLTGRFQTHKHVKYKLNQEAVDLEYANLCKTASGPYLVLYDLFILFQTIVTVIRAEGL